MKKSWRILLILVAAVGIGVALSYPIRYKLEERSTEEGMDRLLAMRDAGLGGREGSRYSETISENEADEAGEEGAEEAVPRAEGERRGETAPPPHYAGEAGEPEEPEAEGEPAPEAEPGTVGEPAPEATDAPEAVSEGELNPEVASGAVQAATEEPAPEEEPATASILQEPGEEPAPVSVQEPDGTREPEKETQERDEAAPNETPAPTPALTDTPVPTPTPNRFERDGAKPYDQLPKRTLDEDAILPQFKEIYEENHDFVGWINIPGTAVDYPVMQTEQNDYYLRKDFYGNKNANGTIILDSKCDPYTPSYNLVISGHSMRSGKMFGRLVNYMYESYWKKHKLVYFDNLMEENTYVVFAAFFSADYDVDEKGFRYNADIQYSLDARQWLREVEENELYDTGIDVEFGDEFLTLTTCNHAHRSDGRFVVVCRKLREGEEIE